MVQMARHMTMADWGLLAPGQSVIHDRDGKFCPAFQHIIDAAGIKRVPLPARSPGLHACAERGAARSKMRRYHGVSCSGKPLCDTS